MDVNYARLIAHQEVVLRGQRTTLTCEWEVGLAVRPNGSPGVAAGRSRWTLEWDGETHVSEWTEQEVTDWPAMEMDLSSARSWLVEHGMEVPDRGHGTG